MPTVRLGAEASQDAWLYAAFTNRGSNSRISRPSTKDRSTWRELLVNDGRLTAEYFSAAPGTRVSRRFHPDTREWFAVVEGEVRVEIEGQEPFTATRGSLVNIPRQTIYSVETIGNCAKPALYA